MSELFLKTSTRTFNRLYFTLFVAQENDQTFFNHSKGRSRRNAIIAALQQITQKKGKSKLRKELNSGNIFVYLISV